MLPWFYIEFWKTNKNWGNFKQFRNPAGIFKIQDDEENPRSEDDISTKFD